MVTGCAAARSLYSAQMAQQMSKGLIFRGRFVLPDRVLDSGVMVVTGGRIQSIGRSRDRSGKHEAGVGYGEIASEKGDWIVPGFVDIHVHGGAGFDYMDGTVDAVRAINRAHLRHGTTTIFPTTTTGSPKQVRSMLEACQALRKHWQPATDGARIGGVHLYGPYFAENKVGCHSPDGRRDPRPEEYDAYFKLGIVKIATCAAELPGAEAFYRTARRHKCLVTCGHSNATWAEMKRGYQAGVRHVDHFWCAMSSVSSLRTHFGTPMQASMEQFVLAYKEMSTEVIADGEHLSPELLDFAYLMKGAQRLCLVTDANRALDMPPGRYRFGPQAGGTLIESNGRVGLVPGGSLASSIFALDTMVRNMKAMTRAPIEDVVRMASLTPAERVGRADSIGSLEVGKRADVVILDRKLQVKQIFVQGVQIDGSPERPSDA